MAAGRSPCTTGTARRPPAHPDPPVHRNLTSCRVHDATPAVRSRRPVVGNREEPSAIAEERALRGRILMHRPECSFDVDGRSKKSGAAWRLIRLCAYRKRRTPTMDFLLTPLLGKVGRADEPVLIVVGRSLSTRACQRGGPDSASWYPRRSSRECRRLTFRRSGRADIELRSAEVRFERPSGPAT
jgi:hypothetical protein